MYAPAGQGSLSVVPTHMNPIGQGDEHEDCPAAEYVGAMHACLSVAPGQ